MRLEIREIRKDRSQKANQAMKLFEELEQKWATAPEVPCPQPHRSVNLRSFQLCRVHLLSDRPSAWTSVIKTLYRMRLDNCELADLQYSGRYLDDFDRSSRSNRGHVVFNREQFFFLAWDNYGFPPAPRQKWLRGPGGKIQNYKIEFSSAMMNGSVAVERGLEVISRERGVSVGESNG
jgi:hypothetical protein